MTDKDVVENAVSEFPGDNLQGVETPCPYFVGDRVMHNDGRVGVVVNSGFAVQTDPNYGKKFIVRPERKRETWLLRELDGRFEPSINQKVQHKSGAQGIVAGFVDGAVVVWPYRDEKDATWKVGDIAGFADVVIREKALSEGRDGQEQIAAARDALQVEYDQLMEDYEGLAKLTPFPSTKVHTKLLVRNTVVKSAASEKFTDMATTEVEQHLNAGWTIIPGGAKTHTVVDPSNKHLVIVETYLLIWEQPPADEFAPLDGPDDLTPSPDPWPVSGGNLEWTRVDVKGRQQAARTERVVIGRDPAPWIDPGARMEGSAFAEALRDGVEPEMLKAIGNAEALNRGRMVFMERQAARPSPVSFALTPGPSPTLRGARGERNGLKPDVSSEMVIDIEVE